jgi:hypothetical protein
MSRFIWFNSELSYKDVWNVPKFYKLEVDLYFSWKLTYFYETGFILSI